MPDGRRLQDKVALITGAARGQGAAEAKLFAQEGAAVALADVLDEEGRATAAAVGGSYHHLDVTDEAAWKSVVEAVVAEHGPISVLVNNAGIYFSERILNMTLVDYQRVIDVNQIGVFLGMKTVGAVMVEQGTGSVVNISSVAGLRGNQGSVARPSSPPLAKPQGRNPSRPSRPVRAAGRRRRAPRSAAGGGDLPPITVPVVKLVPGASGLPTGRGGAV